MADRGETSQAPPLAGEDRRLVGAPFVPAEARAELLALKGATAFLSVRPDGEIAAAAQSGEGFYFHDTRHLSELRLLLAEEPAVLLSSVLESGQEAQINQTNPWLTDARGRKVPQEAINLRRTFVLLDDRLLLRLRLRSYCLAPLALPLRLVLGADFADVFEVRAGKREAPGRLLPPSYADGLGRLRYQADDGFVRETILQFNPPPGDHRLEGKRVALDWTVPLSPGEPAQIELSARPLGPRRRPLSFARRGPAPRPAQKGPVAGRLRAGAKRKRTVQRFDRRLAARPPGADDAGRRRRAAGSWDPLVRRPLRPRLPGHLPANAACQPPDRPGDAEGAGEHAVAG